MMAEDQGTTSEAIQQSGTQENENIAGLKNESNATSMRETIRIAIAGCTHGEMDQMYWEIEQTEKRENRKIDLVICCGDFQAIRNYGDLQCMAVPAKFRQLQTFYKYYSGEKVAPVLTIFVGGNHESSGYLAELPYGGWVAPNIYYMGLAGVLNFRGLKIAGLSGIYKAYNYDRGHFEAPPYTEDTKKSAYHVRSMEVFKLKQLEKEGGSDIDIMISHDWPNGVFRHGDVNRLLQQKQFFREDVEKNQLGNPYSAKLLELLKPRYWFAAHLHVRFPAEVRHPDGKSTRFLALDKCLPRRKYLEIINFQVPPGRDSSQSLSYDMAWLSVLRATDHLTNIHPRKSYMPGPGGQDKHDYRPTEADLAEVAKDFGTDLAVPLNFTPTAPAHCGGNQKRVPATPYYLNPQTQAFASKLKLNDLNSLLYHRLPPYARGDIGSAAGSMQGSIKTDAALFGEDAFVISRKPNPEEINLDDLDDETTEEEETKPETGLIDDESNDPANTFLQGFEAPSLKRPLEETKTQTPDEPTPQQSSASAMLKFKRRNAAAYEPDPE